MQSDQVILKRLQALRSFMAAKGLQACLFPTADPHLSEYLPEHWQGRAWLSGFDGSAGTLLVTATAAYLWTDSRYWVQAKSQLVNTGIKLMRHGADSVPGPLDWVCANLQAQEHIAIDANVLDYADAKKWQTALATAKIKLVTNIDSLAVIWADRPALPNQPVFEHQAPFACRSRAENIQSIRHSMLEQGADYHFISSLDDIAWILNLRGSDIDYNPVFLAHLLISHNAVTLYVDQSKITATIAAALAQDNINVAGYTDFANDLARLNAQQKLLIDPQRVTLGSLSHAKQPQLIESINPSQLLKAQKNQQEADNIRATMRQDGAALCEFFAWFEHALANGACLSELDVDKHLSAARAKRDNFVSLSFPTIAGYNSNGAMPHYQATNTNFATITGNGLLLIDSGGQYLGGTTDITRVIPIGTPNEQQCVDYTLVLKAHINLAMAKFPLGVQSSALDILARTPLWQAGLDYGHGTGHGVGYFLNVHEGPQSISFRGYARPNQAMLAGMLTSNEPGLYRAGKWGIRIESLVLTVADTTTEFGEFLSFETVTLCPINTKCVVKSMLNQAEIEWLNGYHSRVRQQLQDLLEPDARNWLIENTQAL